MLKKSQILAAKDLRTVVVNIPEWGGDVLVRLLTAAEREEITSIWTQHVNADNATKSVLTSDAMLLRCTVDESGAQLFDDADLPALKKKSAIAINRIIDAALTMNKMNPGAVEDGAKNLPADQTGVSSSD